MTRPSIAVALLAALLVAAPFASAQTDSMPEDRTFAAALGEVSMPRETSTDADGTATITADVTVNASVAQQHGAQYILIGVGNDNATDLTIQLVALDGDAEATRTEGDGTSRAQWWLNVADLPATASFSVEATAKSSEDLVDVETLVMAMDENYEAVSGADGLPLVVTSFTNVRAAETPQDDTLGNETDDDGLLNDTLDNDTGANDSDNTTGNDTEEESGSEVPAAGAVLALAAVGVAAVATTLARRKG